MIDLTDNDRFKKIMRDEKKKKSLQILFFPLGLHHSLLCLILKLAIKVMQLCIKRYLIPASLSQAVKCFQNMLTISRETKQYAELRYDTRYSIVFSIQSVQFVFSYTNYLKTQFGLSNSPVIYHGRSSLIRRFIYRRKILRNFLHYCQRAH